MHSGELRPRDMQTETTAEELRSAGFGLVRDRVHDELIDALRAEADGLNDRFARGERPADFWCYDDAGRDMLYRIHRLDLQPDAPHCRALFRAGPLHGLAEELLGPAGATVCAMVVKTPGVHGVPWHRDRTDLAPGQGINLSVFLDDATTDNGCLEIVPASHRFPDAADVDATVAAGPVAAVPACAGDVLVHDVRLVHGSPDNAGGPIRRSVIIEFVARP